jgi:FemAB-related protein (PEP-CTERM system-associated)
LNNTCQIKSLSEHVSCAWDSYVNAHAQGTFFHLSGWFSVVQQSFGHACHFLYSENDQGICGLLPLVEIKSTLFGHLLISTPFCVYGGAIADNEQIVRLLEHHACELAEQLGVDYLELRYQKPQKSSLLVKQAHSVFGWQLAQQPDQILSQVKKKQRAVIRHSLNNQLKFTVGKDVDVFYPLFCESYRDLGTPVLSKQYFEQLIDVFAQYIDIAVVYDQQNKPSSAVMNFYYKDQVQPYYGGGNKQARQLKSADFMYFNLMCHASKKGTRWFDFGRSKNNSGAYQYKKNWGMQAHSLYYYYYLVNCDVLPDLSPNNPKYRFLIYAWQKLPLALSQWLGPGLAKYLG